MATPRATDRYQSRIAALTALVLLATRRAWAQMRPAGDWEGEYEERVAPALLAVITAAQIAAAREADVYMADVLNELDFGPVTEPGVVVARGLAGVTGDGRPVDTLLATTVGRARAVEHQLRERLLDDAEAGTVTVRTPSSPEVQRQALLSAQAFMDEVAASIVADTARAAEEAAMAARPWVDGFIRYAEPGACSRCIVLTGKFFLFNEGFLRHPRCRCSHIPAPTDPEALRRLQSFETPMLRFEALTEREQDEVFGAAGAQAIRDGADVARVVNARRGMARAQNGRPLRVNVNGRMVYVTTEATTRRGRTPTQVRGARIMPESILEIAGQDADERIRLLKLHGFIL